MTFLGGSNNNVVGYSNGVIFSFDPATNQFAKLKDFDDTNGRNPFTNSLFLANNGKFYGVTPSGGLSNSGVIFSFDPATSTYTKLKDFNGANGKDPYGSLIKASNGKLYGMTRFGGAGYGVIFSFDPATSTFAKLKNFDYINGDEPFGRLLEATNGKLYGMTYGGGSNGTGVIFSFDPATSAFAKLKDFDFFSGNNPNGSLMRASNGKLYGVTFSGGTNDYGVIFSFDPATSAYTKLKDFNGTNGANPRGTLCQASNGKLYGTTYRGGSMDYGVIFSFDPATSAYNKLKDFDNTDGALPQGSLLQASNGKLYGLASQGGSTAINGFPGHGVIFSFDPATSAFTKVKDLDGTNGSYPTGSLSQASDGKLYGMTNQGGSSGLGVVFSFDPATATFTKLQNFNGTNGGSPIFDALIEVNNNIPFVFYSKPTSDLNLESTWGSNVDGTGTSPADFGVGKTFNLANRGTVYTLINDWSVGGIINIPAGNQLQLNGKTLSEAGVTGTGTITGSATSSLIITGSAGGNAGTHYFTAGAGAMLNNLTLLRSGASASATIGSALNIYGVLTLTNGTLNTGNFITLKSTASNTARVAPLPSTASITGNVTVERYIPARKAWRLMSAPVAGTQTVNAAWQEGVTTAAVNPNPYPGFGVQITGGTLAYGFDQPGTSSIKKYNSSTDTWIPLANTNATAVNSDAFMLFIAGDRTLNPANTTSPATSTILRSRGPLKTSSQTFPVSATGFTAVPNPFASPVNFATITRTNVQNSFYVWDPKMAGTNGVGAWVNVSWNGSSYDITPAAISPESQYIQSGQGFMVHSTGVAGSMVIKETDKAGIPATNVFRSANIAHGVRITLQSAKADGSGVLLDEALSSYSAAFSDDIDNMDVVKLANIQENLGIVRSGNVLMVERRSAIRDNDTIALALTNTSAGSYRFEINAVNLSSSVVTAYLEDMYRHTSTPVSLSGITRYDFAVNKDAASKNPYRFRLILGSKNAQRAAIVATESSIKAYPNPVTNGNINITLQNQPKGLYTIQLLNSEGSLVFSTTTQHEGGTATKAIQLNSNVAKGVYQLKVTGTALSNSIKVVIER